MSDQTPAAVGQPPADNPDPGAGTTDAAQIPSGYVPEDQYNELRGWSTRESQWRSQHESTVNLVQAAQNGDQEAAQQLLAQLGYEVDSPPEDPADLGQQGGADPQLVARLEALETARSTEQQTVQERQQYDGYRRQVNPEIAEKGVPEGIQDAVADYAYHNLPGIPCPPSAQYPNGVKPDIDGAVQAIQDFLVAGAQMPAVQTAVKKGWQRTKPTSALTQPGGAAATHTPSLDTRAKKADWIAQQLSQLDADDQAVA